MVISLSMSNISLEEQRNRYRTALGVSAESLSDEDLEILVILLQEIADIAIRDNLANTSWGCCE